ncbi:putative retroelement [Abeliophyllum distichum]|uniref:Retroelement n=1 Tax=Abeliophyllum distichum TaxID=126358 RepID=A0ABD1RDV1_9LAMI
MQDQLDFGMRPIIRPTYRKPYPDCVDQPFTWPRRYKDAIELGRITFEPKKKMAVDENPFPQPINFNLLIPNLDKFGLLGFKLVVDNGEDEPLPSAFKHLKRKAWMSDEMNLCARYHREIGNVTERSYEQKTRPANTANFCPVGGQVRPLYEKQYGSFQGIRMSRPQPQCPNVWHSYNSRMGRVIMFNEMTRTQQRRFQRNYGQMMRQQHYVERSKATIESKVANENVLKNGEEVDMEASKEESLIEECVEKLKFECRKKDEDDDDAGRLITI